MMLRFLLAAVLCVFLSAPAISADSLGKVLERENQAKGVSGKALPAVEDLTFLRRVTIDLVGRIPPTQEITAFESLPASTRRQKTVDRLLADERFADRWTIFFGDMLRIRSGATGGSALLAYVHNALNNDMPYNELAHKLIVTNGKANFTPEVGFVLGDNADPFALASVTSEVFMGIRIGCAQCHDHPFDVWTRESP